MPKVSAFITPALLPRPSYSFKTFQNLPDLVRRGLVWGTQEQDLGHPCNERHVTEWIINRYDVNQTLAIGELVDLFTRFIEDPVRCRMVRCFVDCRCNMLAAKLAWHEDY